jgi:hypothetical protein
MMVFYFRVTALRLLRSHGCAPEFCSVGVDRSQGITRADNLHSRNMRGNGKEFAFESSRLDQLLLQQACKDVEHALLCVWVVVFCDSLEAEPSLLRCYLVIIIGPRLFPSLVQTSGGISSHHSLPYHTCYDGVTLESLSRRGRALDDQLSGRSDCYE